MYAPLPVSVVIPAHNAEAFIAAALQSVAAQTGRPREVIVVCDGCTDGTAAIARALGARVIEQPQSGSATARNTGIAAAGERWIAFLDADDLWLPEKLERQCAALDAVPGAALCFTDFKIFDEYGDFEQTGLQRHLAFRRTVRRSLDATTIVVGARPADIMLRENYILPSTLIVSRAAINSYGAFDPSLRQAEDFEWLLRITRDGSAIGILEPLVQYRRHTQQKTANFMRSVTARQTVIERVLAAPQLYRPPEVKYFRRRRRLDVLKVGMAYVRVGDFGGAREEFRTGTSSNAGRMAVLAAGMASALDNATGRAAYRAVHALWRMRPWLHERYR